MAVYIDPPYLNATPYPDTLSREAVVRLALRYSEAGALVLVSEAEPIASLVALGWSAVQLGNPKQGDSPGQIKKQEWVTTNRPM